MGMFSKLKKPLGAKILKKVASKDPAASKVLGKPKASGKPMSTGGNNRPTAMGTKLGRVAGNNAAQRMDMLQRPQRPGSRLRRTP